MALIQLLQRLDKPTDWFFKKRPKIDTTPIEVVPDVLRPISSLDDIRRMMEQISAEAASQGLEAFEEFYDFGEDSEFEDIPAPAQLKHDAVLLARDRDFEAEVVEAKEKYKERLNAEARATLLADLKKRQEADAKEENAP